MYVCKTCGSKEVQQKEWVNVNSGENQGTVGDVTDIENHWCPRCEAQVDFITLEEWEKEYRNKVPSTPFEDKFFEKYTPLKNHIDNNASWDGCAFETYGADLAYIRTINGQAPNRVWTILEVNGRQSICAGYHYINRFFYLVTKEPWSDDTEEYIVEDLTEEEE